MNESRTLHCVLTLWPAEVWCPTNLSERVFFGRSKLGKPAPFFYFARGRIGWYEGANYIYNGLIPWHKYMIAIMHDTCYYCVRIVKDAQYQTDGGLFLQPAILQRT